jgi:hypothetical protein
MLCSSHQDAGETGESHSLPEAGLRHSLKTGMTEVRTAAHPRLALGKRALEQFVIYACIFLYGHVPIIFGCGLQRAARQFLV